jgi:hypothetical protein
MARHTSVPKKLAIRLFMPVESTNEVNELTGHGRNWKDAWSQPGLASVLAVPVSEALFKNASLSSSPDDLDGNQNSEQQPENWSAKN